MYHHPHRHCSHRLTTCNKTETANSCNAPCMTSTSPLPPGAQLLLASLTAAPSTSSQQVCLLEMQHAPTMNRLPSALPPAHHEQHTSDKQLHVTAVWVHACVQRPCRGVCVAAQPGRCCMAWLLYIADPHNSCHWCATPRTCKVTTRPVRSYASRIPQSID